MNNRWQERKGNGRYFWCLLILTTCNELDSPLMYRVPFLKVEFNMNVLILAWKMTYLIDITYYLYQNIVTALVTYISSGSLFLLDLQ